MAQRGRKSRAELAAVQTGEVLEVSPRPAPPADLTEVEAAIWQETTASLPGDWFKTYHLKTLRSYCKHCAQAQVLEASIADFESAWLATDEGLARFEKMLNMHEKQTRAINAMARSMRITHQAQYDALKASRKAGGSVRGSKKPWEGG